FMGLLLVKHENGWGTDAWKVVFVLKNHGTLPALNIGTTIQFFSDTTQFAQVTEPTSVHIFPSLEVEFIVRPPITPYTVLLQEGNRKLRVSVRIPYQTDNDRHFEYTAEVSYTQGNPEAAYMPGLFTIDKSETRVLP